MSPISGRFRARPILSVVGLLLLARPTLAQVAQGVVRDSAGAVVEAAVVLGIDSVGRSRVTRWTDSAGGFVLPLPASGSWVVRVERLGFGTLDRAIEIGVGETVTLELLVHARPVLVQGVEVQVESRCRESSGGPETAALWIQVREILGAIDRGAGNANAQFVVDVVRRDYIVEEGREALETESHDRITVVDAMPMYGADPRDLAERGFVSGEGEERVFHAPDARTLLSDPFLATHCFQIVQEDGGRIGLAFRPIAQDRVGIAGALWLPQPGAPSARIDFRWVHYPWRLLEVARRARGGSPPRVEEVDSEARFGGSVSLVDHPGVGWVVDHWTMRWPVPVEITSTMSYLEPGLYLGLVREWEARMRR